MIGPIIIIVSLLRSLAVAKRMHYVVENIAVTQSVTQGTLHR